jgi:hypothetical protein
VGDRAEIAARTGPLAAGLHKAAPFDLFFSKTKGLHGPGRFAGMARHPDKTRNRYRIA